MSGFINDTPKSPDEMENPLGAANVGYQENTPVSTGQDIGATFGSGVSRSVWDASQRHQANENAEVEQQPMLQPDDINKMFGPIGPDGKQVKIADTPMYSETAQLVAKQKAAEMDRNAVIDRYSQQHNVIQSFGAGAVGFMLDPINAASVFVPGVGEESALAGMGKVGLSTGNVAARTAARGVAGATAGFAVQAPATLLKYGLDQQEASDYDLKSAFKDMFYNAAFGAIAHAGFGGLHEAGVVPPDNLMKSDVATRNASMKASIAQMTDGRAVDVESLYPAAGERGSSASMSELAERQQQIYREGFAPNMTGDELEAAKANIIPDKGEEKEPDTPSYLDQKVIDRYKQTISDVAEKNNIPIDDSGLQAAARHMAESHNPETPTIPPKEEIAKPPQAEPGQPVVLQAAKPPVGLAPEALPKLPRELSKASPRFGSNEVKFNSDVDKALYIVRPKSSKQSASHGKYVSFLKNTAGLSDAEISKGSQDVLDAVKAHQKSGQISGELPQIFSRSPKSEVPTSVYGAVPKEPTRINDWVKKQGGIRDTGGDIKSSIGGVKGRPGLINKKGVSVDGLALRAQEAGYFKQGERPSVNELINKINEDHNGGPQYSEHDINAVQEYNRAHAQNSEIDRISHETGIDPTGKTHDQFWDAVSQHMSVEKQLDEVRSWTEAHEHELEQAQKAAREWFESRGESWDSYAVKGTPRTLEDLENERTAENASRRTQQGDEGSGGPESASGNQGSVQGGSGQSGGGTEPSGRNGSSGSSNAGGAGADAAGGDAVAHPEDVAIADLEAKIDMSKLTAEEHGDIAQADADLQAANEFFEQKQSEYAACLAQNLG